MTDYTIASPNGGTWSIQDSNTAKTGRFHDLALLLEGASGAGKSLAQARPGVLVGSTIAADTQSPGAFAIAASTGLTFTIQPGAAVVERTSLIGSYRVTSTAVGTGGVTTADGSQTRLDRVDLQVLDGAVGDNGGTSLTSVKVTAGTPGGGVASAPVNSIPLGHWSIPPNTLALSAATWVPARKSSGLRGGIRLLLEGDSLDDPGFVPGEMRNTSLVATAGSIDVWMAVTGTWMRVIDLSGAKVAQNTNPNPMGSTSSQSFVVPANTAGQTFIAPCSGIVEVKFSADLRSDATNHSAVISPEIRNGGTVGSGTVAVAADDTRSASTNAQTNNNTVSSAYIQTGLTPGATYNIRLLWKAATGAGTATAAGNNPRVVVIPQLA